MIKVVLQVTDYLQDAENITAILHMFGIVVYKTKSVKGTIKLKIYCLFDNNELLNKTIEAINKYSIYGVAIFSRKTIRA